MAEDWNVCRDRLEAKVVASGLACTAQSNYLTLSLRHRPKIEGNVCVCGECEGTSANLVYQNFEANPP